jgi:hypothetical protein
MDADAWLSRKVLVRQSNPISSVNEKAVFNTKGVTVI